MTELKSNSLKSYLDGLLSLKKVTGVAAAVEITAYPDGHAAIGAHPLNGHDELLASVTYLFERLQREAVTAKSATS